MVVVWFKLPFTPLTLSVNVPVGPEADVFSWKLEVVVAGLGVKRDCAPDGKPVTLSVTDPVNPLVGVMVTV